MSINLLGRKRVSPQESRSAAVKAARELLIDEGAAAVTLQAVARKVGRTHANLLHHFGSAAGLQRALAEDIARTVSTAIEGAIEQRRAGAATERDVIDAMFEAFRREGAGELIGWIALTRQREALEPVIATIERIIRIMRAAGDTRPVDRMTLGLTLLAIGDSLAGEEVARATGLPREAVREIAATQVEALAGERLRE
ncbi:MAG: Transcriptional regulator, AcrR family [uncultured Sphingomonas sp.]|uniref:Transcriptional regulator, AcrR family n=1 Tax=uncultured Sphingomonas sp. TaxID=158754 RepID=A0A6J4SDW9_9SPHN|nr:helix-turn-helix domain-containing protein [uncultured Sphingomonas sp.]CAA9495753.1 MAG: Transcriptional regulator, AcrR family [uncultured Sphingomonas sp.]